MIALERAAVYWNRVAFRRTFALAAVVAVCALATAARAAPPAAPLSGMVRVGEAALGGATVVIRAVTDGGGSTIRFLKTEADGTFVLADAPRGSYTILALVPGLPAFTARILHTAEPNAVSFVRLDLSAAGGVLPASPAGDADPWNARAVVKGDVLRDAAAILAALDDPPPAPRGPAVAGAPAVNASLRVPVHASMTSTTGFAGSGTPPLSRTLLGLSGSLGSSVRWGVEGQYSRLLPAEGFRTGDSSSVAVDVQAGNRQSLHLSTQRQSRPLDEADSSRFSAHAVDWTGATGERSQASLSARLVSQNRAFTDGPAADLFASSSDTLDVFARYRTDLGDRSFVRFSVAYRSLTAPPLPTSALPMSAWDREAHVGAVVGMRLVGSLSVEAGATGDLSTQSRGATPELTLRFAPGAFRTWAFASQRLGGRTDDGVLLGQVGTDVADLGRLSQSTYGIGAQYAGRRAGISVEASRREILGTYRLLLSPEFFDRLDSLYFFPGDVASEVSSVVTAKVTEGIDAKLGGRIGRVAGERDGSIAQDDATYGIAEAAVSLAGTRTTLGVGYRTISQGLTRGQSVLRNDLDAVDFSFAQTIPIPILQSVASEWRALFNVEFGKRRQCEDEERSNRRLAGGLAVSF
jgi:hypothetical protein